MVARVCKHDLGTPGRDWSSFLKATLTCSLSPFSGSASMIDYRVLTAVSDFIIMRRSLEEYSNVIFATFTTPWLVVFKYKHFVNLITRSYKTTRFANCLGRRLS